MEKVFNLVTNDKTLLLLNASSKELPPLPKKDKTVQENKISELINSGGELDAEAILKIVSPGRDFNIFISHYHEDTETAQKIARLLQSQGHKPFIDSQYWLHFDSVAEKLNGLHYHKDSKGSNVYDHSKTIMIQKHCDVLLISALQEVMSNCKYLIFINTPNNLVGLEKYSKTDSTKPKSYSPWIYWELLTANILLKSKTNTLNENMRDSFDVPQISYDLSTDGMTKLSITDIVNNTWMNK